MGIVLRFGHATSAWSRLAAKSANRSAVTPASRALGNANKAVHHSAGIRSLCHHLETEVAGWPISAASVSRLGQSSMIERNESMPNLLGPNVPKVKAIMSRDMGIAQRQNVSMDEDESETGWGVAFRQRLKAARGTRTHSQMALLVGCTRDQWNKYENRIGKAVPIRLLEKIAAAAGKSLEWLITGKEPEAKTVPAKRPRRRKVRAA